MAADERIGLVKEEAQHLARSICETLLELVRASQRTPMDSAKVRQCATRLQRYFGTWLQREGDLVLDFSDRCLTVGGVKPDMDFNGFILSVRYASQWQSASISGLVFRRQLDIRDLAKILLRPFHPKAAGGLGWIESQLEKYTQPSWLEIYPLQKGSPPEFFQYGHLSLLLEMVWTLRHMLRQDPASYQYDLAMLRLKRLSQGLVDLSVQGESILALVTLRAPYWSGLFVIVQTVILAVLFGQSLKLGRQLLVNLALTSLLHDLPSGLLEATEHESSRRPELEGIHFFARRGRMDQALMQGLVISGEVRSAIASTATAAAEFHIFSRIVTICRIYVQQLQMGIAPHRALRQLLKNPGGRLDPALLQWFAFIMNELPVGSVVELEGLSELGVVCGHWMDQNQRFQPVVISTVSDLGQFKAVSSEPAAGDEGYPRILRIASTNTEAGAFLADLWR